jgi:repressor LexA
MIEQQKRTIVANIKRFLKENNMTQSDLANKIGIAKSTMSDYMNYRAKPGAGVLEKMAAIFGVSKADIDTTYKDTRAEIIDGELVLVEDPSEYNVEPKIPIIGKIAAGTPIEAIQNVVDRIRPPYDTTRTQDLFGLVVNGDSMNKIVQNGYYAVLRKQEDVENGEIAAVIVNGNYATLKKVYKFTDLLVLEPCSYDSSFKDQQYSSANCEEVKIIGKFLYSVSPMINN